jgi:hypothetical protein
MIVNNESPEKAIYLTKKLCMLSFLRFPLTRSIVEQQTTPETFVRTLLSGSDAYI